MDRTTKSTGTTTSSDEELLRRVAHGDRVAFEALYRRYHRRLLGFVGRWIDRPEAAEEVVDDVLFIVWTDARRFGGRSRVSSWIFGIAHHRALALLRRRGEETGLDESPEPLAEDRELERWELRDGLVQALESLSPDQRAVVVLTYYEGCSYREIAEIVGCPVNTVKTRMFFARKRLKEALERLEETGTREHGGGRHA